MLATIRDTKGQGNAALYVRVRDAAGAFRDFAAGAWLLAETSACRVFLAEQADADTVESRYSKEYALPNGAVVVEYVRLADALVIGEETFTVAGGAPLAPFIDPGAAGVNVANLALGLIAGGRIASFDDATKRAQKVREVFDFTRDAVLEDRDWSFAMDRFVVSRDPAAPAFGYPSRYELPSAALRVVTAEEDGTPVDWVKEGRYVLADTEALSLEVRAVMVVVDPARWTPGFVQAFAARLAAELALPLTEKATIQADMWALYQKKLDDAAANDGRGAGRSQRVRANKLKMRRY
jgi:hypothetical protein